MSFAPLTNPNGDLHRRQLAESANAALRAETANTGTFTVPPGSAEAAARTETVGAVGGARASRVASTAPNAQRAASVRRRR